VPGPGTDRWLAPELQAATDFVRSGALHVVASPYLDA
jgi:hypothetical protein